MLRRLASGDAETSRDVLVVALTLVTGMTDAIGFLRLGGVFTSVMTGNMVLVGLFVAKANGSGVTHVAVALVAYVAGVLCGGRIAPVPERAPALWPRRFSIALALEWAVLAVFDVCFEVLGTHPAGNDTVFLIAVNAVGLGVQSAAVLSLGVRGLSTTYLTGTLTNLLVRAEHHAPRQHTLRSVAILLALVVGALAGAAVSDEAPRAFPALQLGVLGLVIVVGARRLGSLPTTPDPVEVTERDDP
jgi:uncharacterized membrane protein YoaK (UPF0700 family)